MSEKKSENPNNKTTYFLRTQSTILKGEKKMPFNTLFSNTVNKDTTLPKSKINKLKRIFGNFSTGNKPMKTKKYIKIKNKKGKKTFKNSPNFKILDLKKVSGSSHFSARLSYKNNKNIIPDESNGFSLYSISDKENKNQQNVENNKKKNIEKYLENQKINDNNKINNIIYSEYIKKNNENDNVNNTLNNDFLKRNHIIDLNNNDKNIHDYKNNLENERQKIINNNIKEENELLLNNYMNTKEQYYFNNDINTKTNNTFYNPNEEFKESILSKTIEFLNNTNRNRYNNNIINNYEKENINDLYVNNINNNLYNNNIKFPINNIEDTNKYNTYINYNDYQNYNNDNLINNYTNYKNLNYNYDDSKNNNKDLSYNKEYVSNINNKIKNMINLLNYSVINTSRNKKIEFIGDKIYNSKNQFNNRVLCNSERYNSGNKKNNIHSKYFLRSIFSGQNLTKKNDTNYDFFSCSLYNNNKYKSFINFDYNTENKEKKYYQSPNNIFNINRNGNKLEEMLKTIPRHKKKKYQFNYNNIKNKMINNNNNIFNKNKKLSYEEIDNIMPPNILVNE